MVLGITGKSGSGKHTAADFFAQKQWMILDADKIAHYLYRPYTHVWKAIVKHFGEGILSKNDLINRQKLSQIVFDAHNPEQAARERKALNAIVHPAIRVYLEEQIHRHFERKTNLVIVAALAEELELPRLCDNILLIKADPDIAFKRIQARDSLSRPLYEQRVRDQSEPKNPDQIIENNGTLQEFYRAMARVKYT